MTPVYEPRVAQLSSDLAEAYFETGRLEEAKRCAFDAINTEQPRYFPYAIYTLGQIHAKENNLDLAEESFKTGIKAAEQLEDRFILAYLHRIWGKILWENERDEEGKEHIQTALSIFESQKNEHEVAATKALLAKLEGTGLLN